MTIHSKRATDQVLSSLERYREAGVPVMHWYSGSVRSLERAIKLGCWFSVGPGMIAAERGRNLIARMPRDRVLTETDGPFTMVDGRSTVPWDVQRVIAGLSEIWNTDSGSTARIINDNLSRLVTKTDVFDP